MDAIHQQPAKTKAKNCEFSSVAEYKPAPFTPHRIIAYYHKNLTSLSVAFNLSRP